MTAVLPLATAVPAAEAEPPEALPVASWAAVLAHAPRDDAPQDRPSPVRLRPLRPVPLYAAPDPAARPFAVLPVELAAGFPTWLPVVGGRPGWARVLLASRRDGSVGWLRLDRSVEQVAHRAHIEVDTRARTVTLWRLGARTSWPAGVGRAYCPTPRGRTFVLGELHPARGLVDRALVLAAHAPTHLAHSVGMAAIGLHTWPTAQTGLPDSDGSVIVPAAAVPVLAACALPGTAVLIR